MLILIISWVRWNIVRFALKRKHWTSLISRATQQLSLIHIFVNVVIIRLAKTLDLQTEHELHRFLGALFLPELSAEEKNDMLERCV